MLIIYHIASIWCAVIVLFDVRDYLAILNTPHKSSKDRRLEYFSCGITAGMGITVVIVGAISVIYDLLRWSKISV